MTEITRQCDFDGLPAADDADGLRNFDHRVEGKCNLHLMD